MGRPPTQSQTNKSPPKGNKPLQAVVEALKKASEKEKEQNKNEEVQLIENPTKMEPENPKIEKCFERKKSTRPNTSVIVDDKLYTNNFTGFVPKKSTYPLPLLPPSKKQKLNDNNAKPTFSSSSSKPHKAENKKTKPEFPGIVDVETLSDSENSKSKEKQAEEEATKRKQAEEDANKKKQVEMQRFQKAIEKQKRKEKKQHDELELRNREKDLWKSQENARRQSQLSFDENDADVNADTVDKEIRAIHAQPGPTNTQDRIEILDDNENQEGKTVDDFETIPNSFPMDTASENENNEEKAIEIQETDEISPKSTASSGVLSEFQTPPRPFSKQSPENGEIEQINLISPETEHQIPQISKTQNNLQQQPKISEKIQKIMGAQKYQIRFNQIFFNNSPFPLYVMYGAFACKLFHGIGRFEPNSANDLRIFLVPMNSKTTTNTTQGFATPIITHLVKEKVILSSSTEDIFVLSIGTDQTNFANVQTEVALSTYSMKIEKEKTSPKSLIDCSQYYVHFFFPSDNLLKKFEDTFDGLREEHAKQKNVKKSEIPRHLYSSFQSWCEFFKEKPELTAERLHTAAGDEKNRKNMNNRSPAPSHSSIQMSHSQSKKPLETKILPLTPASPQKTLDNYMVSKSSSWKTNVPSDSFPSKNQTTDKNRIVDIESTENDRPYFRTSYDDYNWKNRKDMSPEEREIEEKFDEYRKSVETSQVILHYLENIKITVGDIQRLVPGEFLNDNLIDFYLTYLQKESPDHAKKIFCEEIQKIEQKENETTNPTKNEQNNKETTNPTKNEQNNKEISAKSEEKTNQSIFHVFNCCFYPLVKRNLHKFLTKNKEFVTKKKEAAKKNKIERHRKRKLAEEKLQKEKLEEEKQKAEIERKEAMEIDEEVEIQEQEPMDIDKEEENQEIESKSEKIEKKESKKEEKHEIESKSEQIEKNHKKQRIDIDSDPEDEKPQKQDKKLKEKSNSKSKRVESSSESDNDLTSSSDSETEKNEKKESQDEIDLFKDQKPEIPDDGDDLINSDINTLLSHSPKIAKKPETPQITEKKPEITPKTEKIAPEIPSKSVPEVTDLEIDEDNIPQRTFAKRKRLNLSGPTTNLDRNIFDIPEASNSKKKLPKPQRKAKKTFDLEPDSDSSGYDSEIDMKLITETNDFDTSTPFFLEMSKFSEKVPGKSTKLFEKKYILIPINENIHWKLVVICNLPKFETSFQKKKKTPKKEVVLIEDGPEKKEDSFDLLMREAKERAKKERPDPNAPAILVFDSLGGCEEGGDILEKIRFYLDFRIRIEKPEIFIQEEAERLKKEKEKEEKLKVANKKKEEIPKTNEENQKSDEIPQNPKSDEIPQNSKSDENPQNPKSDEKTTPKVPKSDEKTTPKVPKSDEKTGPKVPKSLRREFTRLSLPSYKTIVPHQSNGVDCGVFLCKYVQKFVENPLTDIPINKPDWFAETPEIPEKRKEIRDLIINNSKDPRFKPKENTINEADDSSSDDSIEQVE